MIGKHTLRLELIEHPTKYFSHRLVFGGARKALSGKGLNVRATQTSAGGRGTELAVAVRIDSLGGLNVPLVRPVELALEPMPDPRFNRLLVFRSLRDELSRARLVIGSIEKTEGGREADIAIRVRIE